MDVTKLPNVLKGTEIDKYQVGQMLFIAFKDIPPREGLEYLYSLLVIDMKNTRPTLCITAETMSRQRLETLRGKLEDTIGKADAAAVIENDDPFMCVVDETDIRVNLGSSPEWKKEKAFFAQAKVLAMEHLGLNPTDHPTITKPQPKPALSSEKSERKLAWFGVVVIIGSILSYWIFSHPIESKEQKQFLLQCLSQHNSDFCDRLWEQRQQQ